MKELSVKTMENNRKPHLIQYIKEFQYLKFYIISVSLVLLCTYSIFLFFNDDIVANLGKEDHFFEWLTALYFLASFLILFVYYIKTKNYIIFLLSLVLFFSFGEEISWGQRIFNFETPIKIKENNIQGEFTIHNLEIFSQEVHGIKKKGFERLLEINFLFRLLTMVWGIVLPFITYHYKFFNRITLKLKLPIPPITIGIFFFINWITYRIFHTLIISKNMVIKNSASEIFESIGAFIILTISVYFISNLNKTREGNDIKALIR